MCSSHRELNGADSDNFEPPHPGDDVCELCLRQDRTARQRGKGSWLCDGCHESNQRRYAAMTGGAA